MAGNKEYLAFNAGWKVYLALIVFLCCIGLSHARMPENYRRLAELKCRDGKFGYLCGFTCNCKLNEPCDKENGSCPNGCKDGYWGPGCQLQNLCYYNGLERMYMGFANITRSGRTCQDWSSNVPHSHQYRGNQFPDRRLPRNYCRVTTDSKETIWCYTMDPRSRWEVCGIKNCACPYRRFGTNCLQECHCRDSREHCDSELGRCSNGLCAPGWGGYNCQTPLPCEPNRYGWHCENTCQCENPNHCDRFLGATSHCVCKPGYYDPPSCRKANPPIISEFFNEPVNPGQSTQFNCTVSAEPMPEESEISVIGPPGRKISHVMSFPYSWSTRRSIFRANYVLNSENFTCVVNSVAGYAEKFRIAHVYELPRLNTPPEVALDGHGPNTVKIIWHPWDKNRGDSGDAPILMYTIHTRHAHDKTFSLAGQVFHRDCRGTCSFIIKSLQPNSKYSVYISTKRPGAGGDGPPGPIIHVRTKCTAPGFPVVIKDLLAELQYNSSVPKTMVTLRWEPPDPATINCNEIKNYLLTMSKEDLLGISSRQSREMRTLELPAAAAGQYTLSGLDPFSHYCFVLSFENDAGLKGLDSQRKCVITPQTEPDPPSSPEVRSVNTNSVMLSWEQPVRTNGDIKEYHILYWEGRGNRSPTEEALDPKGQVEIMHKISGLQPNTYYRVQVFAVNSAGRSEATDTLSFTTQETVPGLVRDFTNVSVSPQSLQFRWKPPQEKTGVITGYTVECILLETLSNKLTMYKSPPPMVVSYEGREVWLEPLIPATKYNCSIHATTSKGDGPKSSVEVWTDALGLSPPRPPEIVQTTENTATLKLHESNDRTVRHYRVIVEKTDGKRKRRRVPTYITELTNEDYNISIRTGQTAYVTAQILPHKLRGNFVVGDNRTYDGFFNGPLQRGRNYNIWLAAFSDVNGKPQTAYVKAGKAVTARSYAPESTPNTLPIIVGVIVVFILLIAIFALLLLMWRRRHLAEEREKADMPSFGPTILPEPETSTPPTPIGMMFPFAEHIEPETEPLIESAKPEILLDTEPNYSKDDDVITPVKVEDLWDYIRSAKQNDLEGLKREYKLLPAGITSTCEVARKNENKLKNRYGNIIAYDHTRVVLDPEGDDEHDDYINANYIDGYNKQRAYIAAQGPNKPTINDIWRMVWKENSKTLIMLTNPTESGKKKCEQYWPDEGCGQYGNIAVQLLDVDVLPDFTVRTFLISKGGQSKYVKQFHYTTWPDHGVPRFGHSLLLFRQKIRAYDSLDNGTVVIHCSAGVGRTGTYIAVDTQLERAKSEGIIDVHNFVLLMRTQRVNMVQTMEQYVFVYDCLLEALICGDTTVSSHAFPEVYTDLCLFDKDIAKTKLEEQFEILKLLSTTIERDESTTALRPENIFKNRCKNIIPANRCRPYLMTVFEGSNDYINAVFLNSYCKKDQLLVTQMPLPNTVVDFWRLVYDHRCFCIVMLNEVESQDDTCEQYWTEDPGGADYGPFQVETTSEIKSNPIVTVRDFTLTNSEVPSEGSRQIRQFHFHRWQEGSATPSSQRALLELLDLVNAWQLTQDGPITVHCMNGASRSGLFCAALTILERVQKEKEVDVFQAVKQLRLNRTQLIDNMEQYRFCHELVMEFLTNPEPTEVLS